MVVNDGAGWRKNYYKEIVSLLNPVWNEGVLPERLRLPISSTGCMFEFGGSKYSSGKAMLIATPSGFPNAAIALKNRVTNGLHAASRVWVGCLVGIAHHQFGVTTAGIYILESMESTPDENFKKAGNFRLLTGVIRQDPTIIHELDWISPYDRTYPGLRKLSIHLLKKVEMFECKIPMYLEPFRVIHQNRSTEPKFKDLIQNTEFSIDENTSDLVPIYIKIARHLAEVKECEFWAQLEMFVVDACYQYHFAYPFVYAILCHHVTNGNLDTHVYVGFQKGIKQTLLFHHTGWLYHHKGVKIPVEQSEWRDKGKITSIDLGNYITSNYNQSFLYTLLGVKGGGINRLLETINQSKERCIYVPLKYSLCLRSYK